MAAVAALCIMATFAAGAGGATLPDGRRYELVSAPDKNGADALLTTERTRVASDGNAFGYAALAGFAGTRAVEVAADYVSVRSRAAAPGSNGWETHGIMPKQRALSFGDVVAGQEPLYVGPYSSDLEAGVFFGASPLTDAPSVSAVPNLYRASGLRSGNAISFQLLSACPLCDATNAPFPPISGDNPSRIHGRPIFAGASADFSHIAFESPLNLTPDAPPQPGICDPTTFPFSFACAMRLYEWDHGTVRLAGVLPDGRAADASMAGEGAYRGYRTPGVVSDGSDGHSRVFFTQPTDASGTTVSEASGFAALPISLSPSGNVFMRVDHSVTEQLNVSERAPADQFPPDSFAPARFVDASADGSRAFFITSQALTNDAPTDGLLKLYMYDASKAGSDAQNLTLVSRDEEPGDGTGNVLGAIGLSRDGHYFYFVAEGELVRGGPLGGQWIYLWHDGHIARVAPAPEVGDPLYELLETDVFPWSLDPQQTRVSPDGRTLLFSSISGQGLTGYDHGHCVNNAFVGCREFYIYRVDTNSVECASCNPSGAPAVGNATVFLGENTIGGTRIDAPNTKPLSDDGSRVFFSTPDALVPEDTNGRYDAYEYDVSTRRVALLTSGRSTSDSYFVNASPSGNDAFVLTREQLVGWDRDDAYDVYDVRVGGGFPEPPPTQQPCSGDSCHGLPSAGPGGYAAQGSAVFSGGGNVHRRLASHKRRACAKGRVLKRVRGKRRCAKARARSHARHARKAAGANRRSS